jgi:hypothetical protein
MTKTWTLEEEQQLIDLKYAGNTYEQIAQIMGGNPIALRKKHSRLMQEYGTPKFWEKVKYLIEEGILCDGGEPGA